MRIPKFEDKYYTKCCACEKDSYMYISKKCLHKLCEKCFNRKFQIKQNRFNCPFCSTDTEIFELSQEDYSKEQPLQILFDEDLRRRNNIYKLIYKRRENFSNNEEYNKYLEFVERCIRNNNEKEIERKYPQNENEKKENYLKRQRELEEITKKLKENSPTHYNSSKFIIDFEGNEISSEDLAEQNPINYEPIKQIPKRMAIIHDLDKEKTTGGYNIKKLNEFLINYSKIGFITKKS